MAHLGGSSLFLGQDVGWGNRESIADFAQVLGRVRRYHRLPPIPHQKVEELAKYGGCPVINGLTDKAHPCQALADLFTLEELVGDLRGQAAGLRGRRQQRRRQFGRLLRATRRRIRCCVARGYTFDKSFLKKLQTGVPDLKLTETRDPAAAVR